MKGLNGETEKLLNDLNESLYKDFGAFMPKNSFDIIFNVHADRFILDLKLEIDFQYNIRKIKSNKDE